jgi:hypothetical protein
MYSFRIEGYDVYFKVSASEVAFQYGVSLALKELAHHVLSFLS